MRSSLIWSSSSNILIAVSQGVLDGDLDSFLDAYLRSASGMPA
jgi:hypothetical protein